MMNNNTDCLYTIYMHKNKIDNKVYIGLTRQQPKQRWKNGTGYKNNIYFSRAIEKYGWNQGFDHIILETGLSLEEANQKEKQLIKYYNSTDPNFGYNIQAGGDHAPHTESTKEKIREKALHWSDQTKKKMSDSAKARVARDGAPFQGKHLSEAAKQKLREVDKSYTQTQEYRQKMSLATRGGKNSQAKKVKAISQDFNNFIIFECKKDALNFLHLSKSSSKFLNKAIENHSLYHGYYWQEIKNE